MHNKDFVAPVTFVATNSSPMIETLCDYKCCLHRVRSIQGQCLLVWSSHLLLNPTPTSSVLMVFPPTLHRLLPSLPPNLSGQLTPHSSRQYTAL